MLEKRDVQRLLVLPLLLPPLRHFPLHSSFLPPSPPSCLLPPPSSLLPPLSLSTLTVRAVITTLSTALAEMGVCGSVCVCECVQ